MGEHDFETRSSETLFTGKIFALRADEVVMPGGSIARREVVEHFGAVAVAALDEDDNVILVYQYRHPVGRRLWELPAGLLDIDGEPAHDTAARELLEETGLAAREWSVLVDLDSTPGFTDESVRVFLATGLSQAERPAANDDEESELTVHRVPLTEAVQMVFSGQIVNAIAVAGVLGLHAIRTGAAQPRSVDAEWVDKPWRFAQRVKSSGGR